MRSLIFLVLLSIFVPGLASGQSDTLKASKSPIVLTPIFHGTLVLQWNGNTIFIDPYGGADRFADFPSPDLVLITHPHGDHLNTKTLEGLSLGATELVAPLAVTEKLEAVQFGSIQVLGNGEKVKRNGIKIKAVPMYNLPETEDARHPKGWGNGYVIQMGGQKIYISGDTEDIEEMRNLKGIDYAFVCMNLPYTMDINQAASAVIEFQPKVVYPYHFRGQGGFSDVAAFAKMVKADAPKVAVRIRDWYKELD